MAKIALRDYQLDAVASMEKLLRPSANPAHPLCVIPTGGGKSLVIAELVRRLYHRPSRPSLLILSHVKELIEQDSNTIRRLAPEIPQGIYSAGLREKRGGSRVVLGTVQTISRSLHALGARSYILIDEAHLCPRKADSQYGKVFDHFALSARLGFTATPTRLDSGALVGGEGAWFDRIGYSLDVRELISRGFLLPLAGVLTEQQALLDKVGTRAGDFIAEQAERAVISSMPLRSVIDEMMALAERRNHILVFAAGVDHANQVLAELGARGVSSSLVVGETDTAQRKAAIEGFREGAIRVLVNVGVLTTGFDAPLTDCIACLRPTKSAVLWQQMLGRGMRLASAKNNCLLLDFVGNLERLGGAGCIEGDVEDHRKKVEMPARKGAGGGRAPSDAADSLTSASHLDPMLTRGAEERIECKVSSVRYFVVQSRKMPGKRMLVASFNLVEEATGTPLTAREFVCVEYAGRPRWFAEQWFAGRGLDVSKVPRDADAALVLAKVLPTPTHLRIYFSLRMKTYLVAEGSERFAAKAGETRLAPAVDFASEE